MAELTDLLTLAEGKIIVGLPSADTSSDTQLAEYISAASRTMDSSQHFGCTVQRFIADEVVSTVNRAGIRVPSVRTAYLPVYTFTAVREYVNGSMTSLTQELPTSSFPADVFWPMRYAPDRSIYDGKIVRRTGGVNSQFYGDVLVTYTAGRVASTTAVPPDFKRACGLVLANAWREKEPSTDTVGDYTVPRSSFPTFAIPNAAKELLKDYWRGTH